MPLPCLVLVTAAAPFPGAAPRPGSVTWPDVSVRPRAVPPRAVAPAVESVLSDALSARSRRCHEELLAASQLLDDAGRVELTRADIDLALADMHLQMPSDTQLHGHPSSFLPASLYAAPTVDVTELVRSSFLRVMEAHPI